MLGAEAASGVSQHPAGGCPEQLGSPAAAALERAVGATLLPGWRGAGGEETRGGGGDTGEPAISCCRSPRQWYSGARCWLVGILTTNTDSALLNTWIRPDHNHHQPSSAGKAAKAECQTLMDWTNRVFQALVAPAAKPKRQLLDQARTVLREKLQLFLEPEAGGGFSQATSQRCSVLAERGLDLAEEPSVVPIRSLRASGSAAIYFRSRLQRMARSKRSYRWGCQPQHTGAHVWGGAGDENGTVGCAGSSRRDAATTGSQGGAGAQRALVAVVPKSNQGNPCEQNHGLDIKMYTKLYPKRRTLHGRQ